MLVNQQALATDIVKQKATSGSTESGKIQGRALQQLNEMKVFCCMYSLCLCASLHTSCLKIGWVMLLGL